MRELENQVALITGGAGAIGRAIAEGFVRAGAGVALVDIDAERLASFESELSTRHPEAGILTLPTDVRDSAQVAGAFSNTMERFGRLDVMVNNAAVTQISPVDELSDGDIDFIVDTNLKGYIYCAREATRIMKVHDFKGSLLFISSKNGLMGASEKCLYSATKGGELTMARALAMELGRFGIRVNSICPDAVLEGSKLWEDGGAYQLGTAARYGIAVEDIPEYYRNRCALKASIDPEDVANAALFLVSEKAAKITGAILAVDGGVAFVR